MPALNPADVQILFLEMQPPIVAFSRTQPKDRLRAAAKAVKTMAEALDIPVLASGVAMGEGPVELIPELEGVEPALRAAINVFDDPIMAARLKAAGRKVLAVAGVSSEIAVIRAALAGQEAGFETYVLVDGCGGLSERSEAAAFAQMQHSGVVLSNVSSFFTGLVERMDAEDGQAVMSALGELWAWGEPPPQ